MNRREFITLIGGVAAAESWPTALSAQPSALPVVGFLGATTPGPNAHYLQALHHGLKETGYVEHENVAIEYRWAENQFDRLPELAADLVRRRVAVIVTTGGVHGAQVTKAATATIPIVFLAAEDPVRLGLVASLARPGGNLTGINLFNAELTAKRLQLLHELAPRTARVAILANPADVANTTATLRDVEAAAPAVGLQIRFFSANTAREIDLAFADIAREQLDAVFVGGGAFFNGRRVQLAQLAAFHRLPAIYFLREAAEAGGLASYGTSIADGFRQLGVYAGRILKGAKPADLPVAQATKFELVINASTARMLGLTVPDKLLATADEVIE